MTAATFPEQSRESHLQQSIISLGYGDYGMHDFSEESEQLPCLNAIKNKRNLLRWAGDSGQTLRKIQRDIDVNSQFNIALGCLWIPKHRRIEHNEHIKEHLKIIVQDFFFDLSENHQNSPVVSLRQAVAARWK